LADCQADGSLQRSFHAGRILWVQLLHEGVHQPRALQQLHVLRVAL
jgi:hypothetical protein